MANVSEVIKCLSDWTTSMAEPEIDECYLFGSAIYQNGAQFDYHKYGSDLDVVVKLRSDSLDALSRRAVWKSLWNRKLQLEQLLLPIMKVTNISKPLVSAIPVTPFELGSDIHKTVSSGFYSTNQFMNLRTSKIGPFEKTIHFSDASNSKNLVGAIQACQDFRNKYLAISANGASLLSPHSGTDSVPKSLARIAAGLAHYLHPREGVNEYDVNEGATLIFQLVDDVAGQKAGIWQTLRLILQQRRGRGNASIEIEDQLLLFELLFDCAARELRSLSARSIAPVEATDIQNQAMIEFAASTSRVKVRVSLPQAHLSAKQIADVQDAIGRLLVAAGFSDRKIEPPEFGSFFQEITIFAAPFVAKIVNSIWKELLLPRLRSEINSITDKMDVNTTATNESHQLSEATQKLVDSLGGVESAVIQIGTLLLVKRIEGNKPVVSAHLLSREQLDALEQKPTMLQDPLALLEFLNADAPQNR